MGVQLDVDIEVHARTSNGGNVSFDYVCPGYWDGHQFTFYSPNGEEYVLNFKLYDHTTYQLTFRDHAEDAFWSQIGETPPMKKLKHGMTPLRVKDQGRLLQVWNRNRWTQRYSFILHVKRGNNALEQADPIIENQNGNSHFHWHLFGFVLYAFHRLARLWR